MEVGGSNKIPFIDTLSRSLVAPFVYWRILAKKLAIPVGLYFVAVHLFVAFTFKEFGLRVVSHQASASNTVSIFLMLFLMLALFTVIAVNCHRTFLVEGEEHSRATSVSAREWRFLGWLIVISILYSVFGNIATKISDSLFAGGNVSQMSSVVATVIKGLILLVPTYLWSRWCLVYPAVATDKRPSIHDSWKWTEGNSFRVFVLVSLIPLLTSLGILLFFTSGIIDISPANMFGNIHLFVAFIVGSFFLISIFEISAISFTYRAIMKSMGSKSMGSDTIEK